MQRLLLILSALLLVTGCVAIPPTPDDLEGPRPPTRLNDLLLSGDLRVADDVVIVDDVEIGGDLIVAGTQSYEGSTADAYETTFAITDPTADRTITFPNSSGTVALNPYGASIEFEGATANEFETTLTVTDPTADRTVTVPNETGAVMMSSLATNATDAANSVTGASNALVFEGSGADAFETSLVAANPGADATLTLPAETAAIVVSSLTTNATDAANSVTGASNALVFEGATANDFEASVVPADVTADRTITLADASGTVVLSSLATNAPDAANSVTGASNALVFEGATANDFETSVTVTDPTADRTVTIPNETAAVMVSSLTTNATDAANSVTGASNALVFEGATGGADAFETSITPADPTADNTVTLADASGTVMLSSLATNAPQAANAVWGASNGLVFEGATGGADAYETTIVPTDPTADRTVTLQDATGTVALTSQAVDMTLTADATGGNAGAKTEFIGLPRIKLVGGAQGTNPASQTIVMADDSPEGEFAPVNANVVEAAEAAIYRVGAGSYKTTWAAASVENDGFIDANLFAGASLEDQESIGMWLYSSAVLASGDLQIVLTDDAPADRKFNIPAVATANVWTWVEVDISTLDAGTGDAISDFAITMTAQGAAAVPLDSEWILYFDTGYAWDSADEEALGTAVLQDGVLSVVNTEGGLALAEYTDYIVHYESGNDFIVYITDQSGADIVALVAY